MLSPLLFSFLMGLKKRANDGLSLGNVGQQVL